jgi:hypothetical protein
MDKAQKVSNFVQNTFVVGALIGVICSNVKLHSEYEKSEAKPSIPERLAWGYIYSIGGVYCGVLGLMYAPFYIPSYLTYKLIQSISNKVNINI